jgi:hypothetical protein
MNYSGIISSTSSRKRAVLSVFLAFTSAQADADGWGILSQHSRLQGYAIVDVGDVSKVAPPFNTKWDNDVYQMNGRCFLLSGYMGYWSYGGKAALLLANAQKQTQLAIFEAALSSVKVELHSTTTIACPSGTNVIPYSDDPEERLNLLRKRQEELKKQIEDLRKRR